MSNVFPVAFNSVRALIRKKDFYVFLLLLLVFLAFLFSENFFGVKGVSRYLKDIGFTCVWLFTFILTTCLSAKQVPEETDSKTIYALLSKPVSRGNFLMSKLLGSFFAGSTAYLVFFYIYLAVSYLKGEGVGPVIVLQQTVFGLCFVFLVSAVSIFFSLFVTFSAAVALSFLVYFYANWYWDVLYVDILSGQGLAAMLKTFLYYLVPHYEFYNLHTRLVHSWDPLPVWVVWSVVLYTFIYSAIILFLGYCSFKKRSL